MKEVYIVSAVRTPIGSFNGVLSSVPAGKLGAAAIKGAVDKIKLDTKEIDEVLMGCVLQANLGQAPARKAAKYAGLQDTVHCTTVNKVCASGMKAVMQATQSIKLGDTSVVVAGGMENMSQVPYYLPDGRNGFRLGNNVVIDGLVKDGLTDVYHQNHMGNSAELCAKEYKITREEQDAFAIESYKRSQASWAASKFNEEIVGVEVPQKKGDALIVKEDEEYKQVKFENIPELRPVFQKDGAVTRSEE